MTADLKSNKSPSLFGVFFYGVLMALFGAVLGFVYLSTFPAKSYSSEAEYEAEYEAMKEKLEGDEAEVAKPGSAYLIEGPILRTRTWETKREQLEAAGPQQVDLSVGELNAWMSEKFGAAAASEEGDSNIVIIPGVPNVALGEGRTVYLNIPTSLRVYGRAYDFTLATRGTIDASGLTVSEVSISSAKVPLPSILGVRLLGMLSQGYQSTNEYTIMSGAFERADSIEVSEDSVVFTLQ